MMHRRNMGLVDEMKPYKFVIEGGAYEVMLPEKFLRPLNVRLPDGRIVSQKYHDGVFQNVSFLDNFDGTLKGGLTVYAAKEVAEDTPSDDVVNSLQGAIIFTGISAGAVYGLLIDGNEIFYGGRMELERARELLKGRKRILTVDGDDNDITGLWLPR